MPQDKSQLETLPIEPASTTPLRETHLPEQSSLAGEVLDSRYVIEKELGQGGVGAVYLARDRKLHDKPVVVKVLLEKSLQNTWVLQKFQQEKEALARVDHPGVVGILDTGELADGKPYIVMQFVDGASLRAIIRPEGVALERTAEIIKQIGRALGAAHDKGIFHRDLKPENIMLQSFFNGEDQVKIIDFGIAKLKGSTIAPSTMTGATAGTVSYMAPEQLGGKPVLGATDIYALGVIAYELVTGRRPFNPETGFELLEMQRAGVRVRPSDLRPSLSEEADQLILRALSFEPKDRFQTAREFGDAFARALNEETLASDPKRPDALQIPPTQLATDASSPVRSTAELAPKTIAARFEPARVDSITGSVYPSIGGDHAETRRSWMNPVIALALVTVIGLGAALVIWKRDAIFGKRKTNAAVVLPERSLNYSLTVQKMRNGKPYQGEFQSSGQEIFENGWKFRMNIGSPEGHLYLLNEGPASGDATTYNLLFPEPKTNNGSSSVSADQKLQTAWMRFDDNQGTEKFWLVWSASAVKELEDVKDVVNEKDRGEIKDSQKARAIRDFLTHHSADKPAVAKDSVKKQTTLNGRGEALVSFIELEHH